MICDSNNNLPRGYEPGFYDVICGRGKTCYRHPGNLHMRKVVASRVEEYSAATTKDAKSAIVADVAKEIEGLGHGFVKFHHGTWHVVSFSQAREKISQAFRDLLHNRYKSSIDTRRKVRQAKRKLSDPSSPPPQKLHALPSCENENQPFSERSNAVDPSRRISSLWLDTLDMTSFASEDMEWLDQPAEVFSMEQLDANLLPEVVSSDAVVPLDLNQRRDSHLLSEAVASLDESLICETSHGNQESYRDSVLFLQKIMPREFLDEVESTMEFLESVQQV